MNINLNQNKKLRLGDMLVQAGVINEEQLKEALGKQRSLGKRLGEVLLEGGYITQQDLTKVLETQLGIESINLKQTAADPKTARMIPENLARRHVVIPVQVAKGHLLLAMRDPLDQVAIQDVRLLVQMPVTPVLATKDDIVASIERVFSQATAAKAADDFVQSQAGLLAGLDDTFLDVNSAPIVRLVNSTLENAVRSGASDVHIEPNHDQMRVRIRVDGILQEVLSTSLGTHGAVSSRVKVMAGLNIAEKRVPQDGRIMINVDRRDIDLRVSTMPTTYGEKVVMRILDRSNFMVGKENLGFSAGDLDIFGRMIAKPHGIILVTGPTGSGKTTTLYSMLTELNDNKKNIITLEDPVEFDMKGINQTQINIKAGLTFASGLRAILRQDPDIVMVGEIRDSETAEIAARAALTGHLVLSTLHTNDAPGAVARIIDMGVEPFLISSSLIGIVAQRLVRKICPVCKEKYEAGEREKRILRHPLDAPLALTKGAGCDYCNHTGYKGRIGVYEMMEVGKEHRLLIDRRSPTDELRDTAISLGMVPLWEDAYQKVLSGVTTLEEMLRVTYTA
ncbi:GspE/PulE family protein [Pelotomaculum isophthalicicum JI]|uniref:GspE/PulE family protein n=1 Tax=Pelotomaculum isophthalicicum JI TaxID=947010 RepID=A0A9X4H966_9FIRM|nr:GspE/PulE family protein [Pelotomaculum isophthalicicum]MDF9409769.1 GspE/PulE family protein [Pelotomaculum isophthalicicum JI]